MKYKLIDVENDAKTSKSIAFGYLTGIMYLAPAKEADGVHTMCGMSTPQCEQACLYDSGMAQVFPKIKAARIRKTLEFITNPEAFIETLSRDIPKLEKEAKERGLIPCVRLNGTSDRPDIARKLAARFPNVQFYDYTKIPSPWKRTMENYHLTFSYSGSNMTDALEALQHGINVAVVFQGTLPETWNGYKVVNGDVSDLRFLDPKGVIVGLKAKGNARKMETGGFIQIGVAA